MTFTIMVFYIFSSIKHTTSIAVYHHQRTLVEMLSNLLFCLKNKRLVAVKRTIHFNGLALIDMFFCQMWVSDHIFQLAVFSLASDIDAIEHALDESIVVDKLPLCAHWAFLLISGQFFNTWKAIKVLLAFWTGQWIVNKA